MTKKKRKKRKKKRHQQYKESGRKCLKVTSVKTQAGLTVWKMCKCCHLQALTGWSVNTFAFFSLLLLLFFFCFEFDIFGVQPCWFNLSFILYSR